MKKTYLTRLCFLCLLFPLAKINLHAQGNADSVLVMNQLVSLRNDFVDRIKAMGYHPRLKPPEIIMDNPPSYGNYDDSTNILRTSNWNTLTEADKAFFIRAGKLYGYSGESYFESSAHRWIFIHEIGHWWRACQHEVTDSYSSEMAADRIDIAYWREMDMAYSSFSQKRFENYMKFMTNPVPANRNKQQYLNDNYGNLPVPAYIWYQASMITEGYNEKPIATFKDSITRSGNRN